LGCIPPGPKRILVDVPPNTNYTPLLSWYISEGTSLEPAPAPVVPPDESVKVGDTCPSCKGTGRTGDGYMPCRDCAGDGRVDEGDPILTGELAPQKSILTKNYYLIYNSSKYVWDGTGFSSPGKPRLIPEISFDITKDERISICEGKGCQLIQIQH
jgi:hypothetical protein